MGLRATEPFPGFSSQASKLRSAGSSPETLLSTQAVSPSPRGAGVTPWR